MLTSKSTTSTDKSAPSSPKPSHGPNRCSKGQLSLSIGSSNQSGSGSSGYATHPSLSPRISASQKTAKEVFKIIAENQLCVVRKFGAEANTLITTIVEEVCRKSDPVVEPNFLHVNQLCAGEMLDCVQRQGLPLIFVNGDCIGGLTELRALDKSGFLLEALKPHDFDLIVLGGGNAGMDAAVAVADLGKKVACLDYAKQGNCENLGSTCRASMHQTAVIGQALEDAKNFGWQVPDKFSKKINWAKLKNSIQEHALKASLNSKNELMEKEVTYVNSQGIFTGTHEITATNRKGNVEQFTAHRFLLAVGLRPTYLDVPGARECCITSDDIFSLSHNPAKTLCIGGTSDSLECAGFLQTIGNNVTVLLSTSLLEGLDREMVERIRKYMEGKEVQFLEGIPLQFEQLKEASQEEAGWIRVTMECKIVGEDGGRTKQILQEKYNTVILTKGRQAPLQDLGLEKLNVSFSSNTQTLAGKREQCLSMPHIYSISGFPEHCREVSKQAGQMLIRRLYTGSMELMDYEQTPAAIFTPLEYACCGLSEEAAEAKYGEKASLLVYTSLFTPAEFELSNRMNAGHCYCKLVCLKEQGEEKVLGLHLFSPNATAIIQGFSLALKLGAKKSEFDRLIGIHSIIGAGFKEKCKSRKNL